MNSDLAAKQTIVIDVHRFFVCYSHGLNIWNIFWESTNANLHALAEPYSVNDTA